MHNHSKLGLNSSCEEEDEEENLDNLVINPFEVQEDMH